MKFEIGDKVKTKYGIGEVLYVDTKDIISIPYLVGIKEHKGNNGGFFLTEEEKQKYIIIKGYENQCEWYCEKALKLIKENK